MMVCRNCGAEIDDKATSCPYCNAMQYDASEAEYMNNLYKMNSQMDNLDDEANKYVFSSVLKSAAIIIICIAAAVLIGIFWGFMRYRADNNSSAERKKIHQSIEWYDNNVSKLDEAYAKADYNTVSELVDGYKGNSSVIQKWNHYSFITLYGSYYRRVNDIYNKNDMLSEYEFDSGFRRSLDLVYFSKNIKSDYMGRYYLTCSDDEKKIVDGWVESAYDFLENKAGITQEEIDSFMISLYPDGYYDYKAGKDYEDKYYKNYQER